MFRPDSCTLQIALDQICRMCAKYAAGYVHISISWKISCTSTSWRRCHPSDDQQIPTESYRSSYMQPGTHLLLDNLNIVKTVKYCGTPYRLHTFWTAEALSTGKSEQKRVLALGNLVKVTTPSRRASSIGEPREIPA